MHTCRNKESLLNIMDGRQYMLDNVDSYSMRDLIDAINGSLLPFLYTIMEKFIIHVTKTCTVCSYHRLFLVLIISADMQRKGLLL